MAYYLKDSIRWITRDNKDGKTSDLVLQVLMIEGDLDQNGQGIMSEKWIDVPIVNEAEETKVK